VDVVAGSLLEPERSSVIAALDAFPGIAVDIEFSVPNGDTVRIVHAIGSTFYGVDEDDFITLQDVTIRHAIEKERAQMRARAEEASRLEALGTLAGGIAHEINTPTQFIGDNLHFIETGANTLLEVAEVAREVVTGAAGLDSLAARLSAARLDFLAREIPAAAKDALGGVERIATIVQAVKDTCYPSAKVPEAFDLNHMIQSVVTVTRTTWKYVAEMKLDLDDCLPPITAVEGEINQVAMNLVINAAHAIGEKGLHDPGLIEVGTRRSANEVIISVGDSGVGIHPELHQRIFDMFFTTKPPGKGTGQGLAISNAIVRRHGGRITVWSEVGRGTKFEVILPLCAETPNSSEPYC